MTESTPERDVTDLATLISEVHQLNSNAAVNAKEVRTLRIAQVRLATSRRRHFVALMLVAFSLAVDMVLTIIVFHVLHEQDLFKEQQICVNVRSQQFFHAEQAKVGGQVAGLRKIRNSNGDQATALAGFNQFISASQHYLDTIGSIKGKCS